MGIDDQGETFDLSPDPLLDTLTPIASKLSLEEDVDVEKIVEELLRNESIFGVDLEKAGLAEKVIDYLKELCAGKGAVRTALRKYTG